MISGKKLKEKKVLLVEDNNASRGIVEKMLIKIGLEVTFCINGEDAVNTSASQHFDIVLMDLNMPVMDGYEATEVIRKKYTKQELPILAFSAFTELEDANMLSMKGFNGYVKKTCDYRNIC